MANKYGGVRAFMNQRSNRGNRGGGGGSTNKPRVPREFYENWNPPGEKSDLPSQKVIFFEGNYTICPQCNRPGSIEGKIFTCPNCAYTTKDLTELLQLPIYPNMQIYLRTGGKRQKGHAVVSSSHDGVINMGDGSEDPRPDALLAYGEQNRVEVLAEAEEKYGPDWNNELEDEKRRAVWRQALRLKPRDHMAHNLLLLGHFHEIEVEGKGFTYKKVVPCTKGIKSRQGKRMTCEQCTLGVPRFFGQRRFWNPTEPMPSPGGGPGKGHLAGMRIYEAEHLNSTCRNCGNDIEVSGYSCPHCSKQVVDAYDDAVTDEMLTTYANTETVCPHCGNTAYMEESVVCVHDTGEVDEAGDPVLDIGCDNPERTTIFDVSLEVCVRGYDTDATLTILGHEVLSEDSIKKLGKAVALMEPYNFEFLVDWDPEVQASVMNKPNPFAPGGFAHASASQKAVVSGDSGDNGVAVDEDGDDPFGYEE